ncbi:MAG: Fic family protein [Microthrixaceae bacterium]
MSTVERRHWSSDTARGMSRRDRRACDRRVCEDLCSFCNSDDIPAVVQAAMAHAQFEAIHPFIDGNGRTGRVLTQMVLGRRRLTTRTIPPVSLVLATESDGYIAGLDGTRFVGERTDTGAVEAVNAWVGTFAGACSRSVADAERFEQRIAQLQDRWRSRTGAPRADSATEALIRVLPGAPVLTVTDAARMVGRSYQAVNEAVRRLADADVLDQVTIGRRNRAYEAPEVIAEFTDFERRLASPAGDTLTAPPVRAVPRRR